MAPPTFLPSMGSGSSWGTSPLAPSPAARPRSCCLLAGVRAWRPRGTWTCCPWSPSCASRRGRLAGVAPLGLLGVPRAGFVLLAVAARACRRSIPLWRPRPHLSLHLASVSPGPQEVVIRLASPAHVELRGAPLRDSCLWGTLSLGLRRRSRQSRRGGRRWWRQRGHVCHLGARLLWHWRWRHVRHLGVWLRLWHRKLLPRHRGLLLQELRDPHVVVRATQPR